MIQKTEITSQENTLHVSGSLDFFSVDQLWEESLPLMSDKQVLNFDFSKVASANSAALALLLEWVKYAKRENKRILFQKIPTQLLSVASVAGLDHLLVAD